MKTPPKLKITYLKAADLVPYARNARTHSEQQVQQIAASIKEFGWTVPILVDAEGGIIAGHGRMLAAHKLGMAEVPTIAVEGLTEAQKRAYILADNKLTLNGGWDEELLKIELKDLREEDFDISLVGFDDGELAELFKEINSGETDPNETPETPEDPVSELGDVWILGKHRIICGSSTEAEVVEKLLGEVKPHLMVTDPPYGVEYDASKARKTTSGSAKGKVLNDDKADWREAWALFPGDVAYVWHAMLHAGTVFESLENTDFSVRAEIVWAKSQLVMSRGHYHPQHESAFYAVRKNGTGHWSGDRKQTTLWQIDKPQKSETGHSTQKPVECMRRPVVNNSSPGQAVYEPFSGSGTTIIACEMEGRCCYAVELNPAYVDVAVKRWEEFSGKKATLEGTKNTFATVAKQRKGKNSK